MVEEVKDEELDPGGDWGMAVRAPLANELRAGRVKTNFSLPGGCGEDENKGWLWKGLCKSNQTQRTGEGGGRITSALPNQAERWDLESLLEARIHLWAGSRTIGGVIWSQ